MNARRRATTDTHTGYGQYPNALDGTQRTTPEFAGGQLHSAPLPRCMPDPRAPMFGTSGDAHATSAMLHALSDSERGGGTAISVPVGLMSGQAHGHGYRRSSNGRMPFSPFGAPIGAFSASPPPRMSMVGQNQPHPPSTPTMHPGSTRNSLLPPKPPTSSAPSSYHTVTTSSNRQNTVSEGASTQPPNSPGRSNGGGGGDRSGDANRSAWNSHSAPLQRVPDPGASASFAPDPSWRPSPAPTAYPYPQSFVPLGAPRGYAPSVAEMVRAGLVIGSDGRYQMASRIGTIMPLDFSNSAACLPGVRAASVLGDRMSTEDGQRSGLPSRRMRPLPPRPHSLPELTCQTSAARRLGYLPNPQRSAPGPPVSTAGQSGPATSHMLLRNTLSPPGSAEKALGGAELASLALTRLGRAEQLLTRVREDGVILDDDLPDEHTDDDSRPGSASQHASPSRVTGGANIEQGLCSSAFLKQASSKVTISLTPTQVRAHAMWAKLRAGVRGGRSTAANFLSELQSRDEFSLVQAARARQQELERKSQAAKDAQQKPFSGQQVLAGHAPLPRLSRASASSTVSLSRAPGASTSGNAEYGAHAAAVNSVPGSASSMAPGSAQVAALAQQVKAELAQIALGLSEGERQAAVEKYFREHGARLREVMQAANPAAFEEEAAARAEAEYRSLAERAKMHFQAAAGGSVDQEQPNKQFLTSIKMLQSQRPYLVVPAVPRDRVERRAAVTVLKIVHEWKVEGSLFSARRKEAEAKDLYDSNQILSSQFQLDWARVTAKGRFRKLVARQDKEVKADKAKLDAELAEVRDELFKRWHLIRSFFMYYSMAGGASDSESILQMSNGQWMAFCDDAAMVSKQRGCMPSDLQTIFIAVNFEEDGNQTAESQANDDDAMMRFEFLEGLVRAAFGKYISSKQMTDASDAVGAFLDQILNANNLPPEACMDPNIFRRERFYNEDVEKVLKANMDILTAVFKVYKAKDRTKYFWIEHWFAFLDGNKLIGMHTGVERREAKLIFAWSQMCVTDELKRRRRAVSLLFFDFLECIARLADLLSPFSEEELDAYFLSEGINPQSIPSTSKLFEYYRHVGDHGTNIKRDSAELILPGGPTRPLAPKLTALMDYLTLSLGEAWGGKDAKDTTGKMLKMATYLSGGIELG